jgi:hypothetical protein
MHSEEDDDHLDEFRDYEEPVEKKIWYLSHLRELRLEYRGEHVQSWNHPSILSDLDKRLKEKPPILN